MPRLVGYPRGLRTLRGRRSPWSPLSAFSTFSGLSSVSSFAAFAASVAITAGASGCADDAPPGAETAETSETSGTTTTTGESTDTAMTSETGETGETTGETGETTGETGETTGDEGLPCNGHVALCDRPLATVTLPATHNSHAAEEYGFPAINRNQGGGITTQLEDGVRGLLLDVYLNGGETVLCHGPCFLAAIPHLEVLQELAEFMETHPREVVVIIYQDDVDPALVVADLEAAGLADLVWTWDGDPTPTLGAMIDAGTRLVISAESAGPPPAWYHHAWDLFWDTPYTFKSAEEFSCELNRGSADNPLFLVNHWVSDDLGLPSKEASAAVNSSEILYDRLALCRDEAAQTPTLVAVDFYEEGDLFAAVAAINGL